MRDEKGNVLSENEILKEALDHLAEACCFLFELESDDGKALAFMVDATLKLGQVIHRGDNPLVAACDYLKYEEDQYNRIKN